MPLRRLADIALAAIAISSLTFAPAPAQDEQSEEPLFQRLERSVKSEVFSLGIVVQTVGDLAWDRDATTPGTNGFSKTPTDDDAEFTDQQILVNFQVAF